MDRVDRSVLHLDHEAAADSVNNEVGFNVLEQPGQEPVILGLMNSDHFSHAGEKLFENVLHSGLQVI